MNFSLNAARPAPHAPSNAPSRAPRAQAGRHTLDLSLGEIGGGPLNTRSFARIQGKDFSADWGNALAAWVNAHSYYPPQAAAANQQGDVEVEVVVEPDGHVRRVTLMQQSGSVWLDMALTGMFRDANLPPLPGRTAPFTFSFLMHYVLINR